MEFLYKMWNYVPFGIIIFNKINDNEPHKCVYANEKVTNWFSLTNIIGTDWNAIFSFPINSIPTSFYKKETQKWFQIDVQDAHTEGVWVVTIGDVTTQKNNQVELESSNKDLEHFAYVASHDLREPLRKISAFAERLNKKYASVLDGDGKLYLERMTAASLRMQSLIDNLLTFSRISRDTSVFVPTDLNTIALNVLNDLRTKDIILNIQHLPIIEAIPIQMTQLFQNLIGNAIKFRKPEGEHIVNISVVLKDKNYELRFEDNGIGFNQEDSDRIFNIFQRLRGRSEFEGTGIGLAICKKIIENHKGHIQAHSALGQGATFVVTLPAYQNETITQ